MYIPRDKDAFPVDEEGGEVCFRFHCTSVLETKIKTRTIEITH